MAPSIKSRPGDDMPSTVILFVVFALIAGVLAWCNALFFSGFAVCFAWLFLVRTYLLWAERRKRKGSGALAG